jgi:hypothetical protein
MCTAAVLAWGCTGGEPPPPGLVEAARDSVAQPARAFADDARLVAWVDSMIDLAGGDMDTRAELELLRLRAVERVLEVPELQNYSPYANPPGRTEPAAEVREFVNAHEEEIAYSEPAGEWLVPAPAYWALYERYRDTRAADEMAWAAANAGLVGECEGMIGCYLDVLAFTYVRYLEERPAGNHGDQALAQIIEQLTLMGGTGAAGRALCGDERTTEGVKPEQLQQIRSAVEQVQPAAGSGKDSALVLIGNLEKRCAGGGAAQSAA